MVVVASDHQYAEEGFAEGAPVLELVYHDLRPLLVGKLQIQPPRHYFSRSQGQQ